VVDAAPRDRPADGLLTLYEAAEQLGVHYMTVYRYVRTGRLPGRKVGVEWRVEPDDLAAFRAGSSNLAGGVDHRHRLVDRLVAGDERGSWSIVQSALAGGLDPDDLYLQVLSPALATIGDEWAAGRLSVGQEHQASVVVLRLIGRLGPLFTRRGRTRGTVVLGAPKGDNHSLPSALFADLLRGVGLGVIDLGADAPPESFVDAARHAERLVAIAISVTTPDNDEAVAETVAALRGEPAPRGEPGPRGGPEVPIVIGGGAIGSDEYARRLGSDHWVADEHAAVALFAQLADEASRARRRSRSPAVGDDTDQTEH